MDQAQQTRRQFFNEQNEQMLLGMLNKNYQQRLRAPLNEKQSSHLERALEHYMSDVFQQNPYQSVQSLNKQVLTSTAAEFNAYLQRQTSLQTATPQTFQETSNRYEQLQQERQRSIEAPRPSVPDYVQPMQIKEDGEVSAMELFEEAKKRRGVEMNAQAEAEMAKRSAGAAMPLYSELPERPDPKALFNSPLDMVVAGSSVGSSMLGSPGSGNPTIARPGMDSITAPRGTLQQDILIKQQDIQTYKETEYNLSVYSADRRWEFDTNEGQNRFNFTVNLYSGNPTNGVSIMPKATARFRNIVKIEFVKAIMPIENTDIIVQKTNATTYSTAFDKNIFGFPFITLTVDELDTNNFGTNDKMDNAFAILQYDGNWTDNTGSMGFTSFIPKFMKCQRVYAPTPLAALTKLSIRLQQPNGNLVSSIPDTLDISGTYFSDTVPSTITNATSYIDTTIASGEYIFIETKKWFSVYQVAAGDRIQIRKLSAPATPTVARSDFLNYMQDDAGLMVVAVGHTRNGTVGNLVDGANFAGYANFIIVRNRFADPTTGSFNLSTFGGLVDNSTLAGDLAVYTYTTGKLINLSHQTQLIFRVVTRDYDSTSLMRPDNL